MARNPNAAPATGRKISFGGYYNRVPQNDDTLLTHVLNESVRAHATSTRWAVPLDDHNSLYIGAAHWDERSAPRSRSLDDYGVDKMPLVGQTAERPYQERQREPGDYDACVSQGPIVNRKAEHLGTTDRGVVMLRRMLARAIQAVELGESPPIPRLVRGGDAVRTYCHEFVYRADPDAGMDDRSRLEAFGRRAAQIIVDTDGLPPAEREVVARERIRDLLKRETTASST